jgi:hypothetical protein
LVDSPSSAKVVLPNTAPGIIPAGYTLEELTNLILVADTFTLRRRQQLTAAATSQVTVNLTIMFLRLYYEVVPPIGGGSSVWEV